jgi:serine/threonine protein kinase
MKTRCLDVTRLSEADAILLHQFLLKAEKETVKEKKVKLLEPNRDYNFANKQSFQVKQILVRRTKTKQDEFGQKTKTFIYSVYESKDILGSGHYGSVYRVLGKLKHGEGEMVYYRIDQTQKEKRKVIKKQLHEFDAAKNESRMGQKLPETKTKKITMVYRKDSYGGKTIEASFLVMQEKPGFDFVETIDKHPYTLLERIRISLNALRALKKIDDAGVIHRDIKPENMKIDHKDNMAVHILDVGLGREKEVPDKEENGSLLYYSPEMMAVPEIADERSDIYSMGLVLRMLWSDTSTNDYINQHRLAHEDNLHAYYKWRGDFYINNTRDVITFKQEMIDTWEKEVKDISIQEFENFLLDLTASRPENRLSIDEAIAVFKNILLVAMKKDEDVCRFLSSPEFSELEAWLPVTIQKDAKEAGCCWAKLTKQDILRDFIETLKNDCATMDEVRQAFDKLDYTSLCEARGSFYRFFGMPATTADKVDAVRRLIPDVQAARSRI